MITKIRNCKLAYRCDRDWSKLTETDDPDERFCESCQRVVHFCHTDSDLAEAIRLNLCVAFQSNSTAPSMGVPAPLKLRNKRKG